MRTLEIIRNCILSRFWTHKPIILTHSLTSECNCSCLICNNRMKKRNDNEMNTKEVFQMLDEAKKLNFVAYVMWGGEPMLRPDFLDILQYAHDLGLYTSIITNGFFLYEKAGKMAKTVDFTWVSVDFPSHYHDELRGQKGIFERIIRGIKEMRYSGGKVAINCVLSKLNLDAVEKLVNLAQRLNVKIAFDSMKIFPGINEKYELTALELKHLFSKILKLKKLGYPILNSDEYLGFHLKNFMFSCNQSKVFIDVSEDGKIQPFWCTRTNKVFGDLRKQSLAEVLNSKAFTKFGEISKGCHLCVNTPTVETSIFYYLFWTWENIKLIMNYALK